MPLYWVTIGLFVTWAVSYPALRAYRRGERWEGKAFVRWGWLAYTCTFATMLAPYGPHPLLGIAAAGVAAGALAPVLARIDQRERHRAAPADLADPATISEQIAAALAGREQFGGGTEAVGSKALAG